LPPAGSTRKKIDNKTVITAESIRRFLDGLPAIGEAGDARR
jgi:hypothetical protein